MGIGKILLIGVGGYLVYNLWMKAGAASGLSVSVKKIKYGGSDLSKSWFDVELGIINPSGETFAFNRFFGQLRFNGELLASVVKDGAGANLQITPAAETVITVPVYINHLSTALAIKDIILKIIAKVPVTGVNFNGMLYVGGIGLPVNQTVDLNFSTPVPGITGNQSQCFTCAPKVDGVLN